MNLPESGKSVFVALSLEQLYFIDNITQTYKQNRLKKNNLLEKEREWLDKLIHHIEVGIIACERQ